MKILKKQIQENILLHKKILSLSTEIKLAVDQIYRCIKNIYYSYIPYDIPCLIRRFIKLNNP